ncbi:hypothetical protein QBC46DRAFT_316923 [Diplogelasinospora grovesii]|uniref:Microbial-type PARG catalytic domain-containing protein n=1 Tax=Diplogelasinospora grovesii TaxID=303347 RepID=A0AAN6N5K7_9PEZI|nr:hypothetical protein QBC46DRAFT_316923 [Diplogelasinospora grovesii]
METKSAFLARSSRRETLKETAQETLRVLPALLTELGTATDARRSTKHTLDNSRRLDPAYCPRFPEPATIEVVNDDTLNIGVALALSSAKDMQITHGEEHYHNPRPVIVNFAERKRPGGGWLHGAVAQEETLCYRSSLYLSLDKRHYPLSSKEAEAIYSPYVVVVRDSLDNGHRLLGGGRRDLPVVSALSVAAVRDPEVRRVSRLAGPGEQQEQQHQHQPLVLPLHAEDKLVFRRNRDRNFTKDNMRLILRVAAYNRHRELVLGALGCGAYENPPEDVAHCWLEVLREDEFAGHWWRKVLFVVYDSGSERNYKIFSRVLQGQKV